MRIKTILATLVLAVASMTGVSNAQSTSSSLTVAPVSPFPVINRPFAYPYFYRPAVVHPFGWYNGYERAAMTRAAGEYQVLRSQARTQDAVAYKMELENNIERLETYHERRRINSQTRFGHLHAQAAERRSQAEMEKQAHSPDVDPVTGKIDWPIILDTEHFSKARGPVDMVFRERSEAGQIDPNHYGPMCDWIAKISDELKSRSHSYELNDYLEAQSFLRSLINEARKPLPSVDSSVQLASTTR